MTGDERPMTNDQRRLSLVHGPYLPAAIVPAVWTGAVRRLGLVTMRALARLRGHERVVRAALGGAGLGVPAFRIGHDDLSSLPYVVSAFSRTVVSVFATEILQSR